MSNYNDLEMKVEDKSENSKATKRHLVSMLKENEEADDSLDIKPPQASVVHRHKKSSSRSSSKRRKHSSKDGGRRKHIHDKPETSSSRKTHHRTREHREHSRELLREKKYHRRCHREAARFRERKHERKHEHDVSSSAGGYSHDSGPELDGDRRSRSINKLSDSYADQVLEDFRKHLLDKRSNNRHSEGYTERYNSDSDDVDIYGGSDQRSKVEQSKEDRERECELRIMTQSTILMSAQREISHEKAECLEKEMKRKRFLKAEREMMQEKEVYQCERREHQRLGKEEQNILREISQEGERSLSRERKKPGMKEEDDEINRSTYRNAESSTDSSHGVVTVSDDLTEEKLQARKVAVCRGKAKTDNTDNCRPADKEENVLSETDEEDNGSTESEEDETADTTSGSHHTDNETTPVNGLTGNEDAASATKPVEKLSEDEEEENGIPFITAEPSKLDFVMNEELPPYLPAIQGCRSVEEFITLNKIEEGSYGVVFRAKDKHTEEIVALKKLKIDKEKDGFPITSLREISTLLKAQHPNIVTIREIVVGDNMNKIFIVMDYVEHDLKSLMGTMKQKNQFFLPGEVKCLMQQLLRAVAHLHDNWILHRDLKTSNLLLSHRGILKVGDFGLAREYGSPLKPYTSLVVTRWYRAPELLLGAKKYSTPVDMWSVGCIFGEFLLMEALFQGKSDIEQLKRVFKALGTPNDKIWPEFSKLPIVQKVKFTQHPVNQLRRRFDTMISDVGMDLMNRFLTYDPAQRISAEDALLHDYFREAPLPIDPMMFPTWPAKSELGHKNAAVASPRPLRTGHGDADEDVPTEGFHMGLTEKGHIDCGPAFRLKF